MTTQKKNGTVMAVTAMNMERGVPYLLPGASRPVIRVADSIYPAEKVDGQWRPDHRPRSVKPILEPRDGQRKPGIMPMALSMATPVRSFPPEIELTPYVETTK